MADRKWKAQHPKVVFRVPMDAIDAERHPFLDNWEYEGMVGIPAQVNMPKGHVMPVVLVPRCSELGRAWIEIKVVTWKEFEEKKELRSSD